MWHWLNAISLDFDLTKNVESLARISEDMTMTLEQFRATCRKVDCIGAMIGVPEMNNVPGFAYQNDFYIAMDGDVFWLPLETEEYRGTSKDGLEVILFDYANGHCAFD